MGPESKQQRFTLIIGLSIPVLMMVFIAAAIHLPRWFIPVEPAIFDFVYSIGQRNSYVHFLVKDNRLIREDRAIPENYIPTPGDLHFYLHEVASNSSHEITFEQAQQMFLDPSGIAPDGYHIEHGRRAGWFPFDSHTDYRKRFLVKDYSSQELNLRLQEPGGYYYNSYQFHGWVTAQ